MYFLRRFYLIVMMPLLFGTGCVTVKHAPLPLDEKYTESDALGHVLALAAPELESGDKAVRRQAEQAE